MKFLYLMLLCSGVSAFFIASIAASQSNGSLKRAASSYLENEVDKSVRYERQEAATASAKVLEFAIDNASRGYKFCIPAAMVIFHQYSRCTSCGGTIACRKYGVHVFEQYELSDHSVILYNKKKRYLQYQNISENRITIFCPGGMMLIKNTDGKKWRIFNNQGYLCISLPCAQR